MAENEKIVEAKAKAEETATKVKEKAKRIHWKTLGVGTLIGVAGSFILGLAASMLGGGNGDSDGGSAE